MLTLALMGLWGCDSSSSNTSDAEGKSSPSSWPDQLAPAAGDLSRLFAEPDQYCSLELEAISPGEPLRLELQLRGEELSGYWRTSEGESQGELQGTRQAGGHWLIDLEGRPEQLRLTPLPDGSFEALMAETDGGSAQERKFEPKVQRWPVDRAIAAGGELSIYYRTQQLTGEDENCQITHTYPELQGLDSLRARAIEAELRPLSQAQALALLRSCEPMEAQARVSQRRWEATFCLNGVFDGLLSLTQVLRRLPEDSLRYEARLVDLRDGATIGIDELFIDGFVPELSQRVRQRLAESYGQDWGLEPERIPGTWQLEVFPRQMVVFFNPYALGPFQVRRIEVSFEPEELADLMRQDGPMQ